jgi:hypothetical protein
MDINTDLLFTEKQKDAFEAYKKAKYALKRSVSSTMSNDASGSTMENGTNGHECVVFVGSRGKVCSDTPFAMLPILGL